jgi:hypothetical protein
MPDLHEVGHVLVLALHLLLPAAGACIAHGVKAVCGKRPKMEDAFSVCTNFFVYDPPADDFSGNKLPARIATQVSACLQPIQACRGLCLSYPGPNTLCSNALHLLRW